MNIAAIDCGTNSIRLLVAEAGDGSITDITRQMRIVRLGQGVDETKRFHVEALERTFAAAREYAAIIEGHGVDRIRFAATSATRDAQNREVFLGGIESILGVRPEVITGQEEASLSFTGAARAVGPAAGRVLVVDLGGGSTELVLGNTTTGELDAVSMDIGSVRITERHLHSDPPTAAEIAAARADVRAQIARAAERIPLGERFRLIGAAGTITTVTAHALGLASYEPALINGARVEPARIASACEDLLARSRAQRAELAFLHEGRIDVIGGGALIWQELVAAIAQARAEAGEELGAVTTSEHDILDGLALSLL